MSTLSDDDRANLAAFLDGELDEETTQAIEAKLSRDPAARREVDEMREAWSLLDYLPRPEPSSNFTHRTMEKLALGAVDTARVPTRRTSPWFTLLLWLLAGGCALLVGAWAGRHVWRNETDVALARQPRLLENFRVYEPLESIDFLRSLDHPDLFGDDPADGTNLALEWPREHARKAPDHSTDLRHEALAFLALSAERREQLVQLDRDIRNEPAAARDRLLDVARRYRDWLDRTDDRERQKLRDTPDAAARLALLRTLREQDWVRLQPKAIRDKLDSLRGAERAEFLKKIRHDERIRQQDWLIAARFWGELNNKNFQPPFRTSDLSQELATYVNEVLKPMLTKEEKDRLAKSEGNWPLFPRTLVELADHHPPALLGPEGPRTFAELPGEVQKRLSKMKAGGKAFRLGEGRWPGYAITLSDLAFRRGFVFPYEMWPTHEKCLSAPMQEFVSDRLQPLLRPEETRQLAANRGKWPEYPQTIQQLSHNHKLQPPWLTLPGPRERWDNYRMMKD